MLLCLHGTLIDVFVADLVFPYRSIDTCLVICDKVSMLLYYKPCHE